MTKQNAIPIEARDFADQQAEQQVTLSLYWIYDRVARKFVSPLFAQNLEVAYRMIMNTLSEGGAGNLTKYPQDFELWYAGECDEDTAEMVPATDGPQFITGIDAIMNTMLADLERRQKMLAEMEQSITELKESTN